MSNNLQIAKQVLGAGSDDSRCDTRTAILNIIQHLEKQEEKQAEQEIDTKLSCWHCHSAPREDNQILCQQCVNSSLAEVQRSGIDPLVYWRKRADETEKLLQEIMIVVFAYSSSKGLPYGHELDWMRRYNRLLRENASAQ